MTPHTCTHCGLPHKPPRAYKHNLSPELVAALRKFKQACFHYGRIEIHARREILEAKGAPFQFGYDEYSNLTKLRFHALVARKEGKRGYWVLTGRGNAFLKGEIRVPAWVKTVDNRVLPGSLGHAQDTVHIRDFVRMGTPDFAAVSTVEEPVQVEAKQLQLVT